MKPHPPPGSSNAHWFQIFNSISFQIITGAPTILYAKSLGASSTVIGLIASLGPLMIIFQLPAAKLLERYSYRSFMLMSWSLRTVFIFLLAVVPLLTFLDSSVRLALLVTVLVIFNFLRGISTTAWMPWMTTIIPETVRGRFLSVNQFFTYAGCLLALLFSALVMDGKVDAWEYALVFLISAVGASVSLTFIKGIPEAEAGESLQRSSLRVPWRAILSYPPFRELLVFNVLYMAVMGTLGVFTIEFLREESHLEVSTVLFLSAFSFIGAGCAMPLAGPLVDRVGSKPLLRVSTAIFSLVILLWCLIASSVLPCQWGLIAALNFAAGAASAIYTLSNVRIAMSTMPEMGRIHFFVLFTVITSLGLGSAPIAWGIMLDLIGSWEAVTGVFHWKRHSIYFLVLWLLNGIAFVYIRRLHESPGTGRIEPSLIYGRLKRQS